MYNSLRLLFAFDKGWLHFDSDKCQLFFGVVKGAFLQGGMTKKCVLIVVFLW